MFSYTVIAAEKVEHALEDAVDNEVEGKQNLMFGDDHSPSLLRGEMVIFVEPSCTCETSV